MQFLSPINLYFFCLSCFLVIVVVLQLFVLCLCGFIGCDVVHFFPALLAFDKKNSILFELPSDKIKSMISSVGFTLFFELIASRKFILP